MSASPAIGIIVLVAIIGVIAYIRVTKKKIRGMVLQPEKIEKYFEDE